VSRENFEGPEFSGGKMTGGVKSRGLGFRGERKKEGWTPNHIGKGVRKGEKFIERVQEKG